MATIFRLRATVRADFEHFSAVGEAFLEDDRNRTTFVDDVLGVSRPVYADPVIGGFDVLLQARF